MTSFVVQWFLDFKLELTLRGAQEKELHVLDLRTHGLEECPNLRKKLTPAYIRSLKCLILQTNYLTCFPRANCHILGELTGLALDYNRLTDLPFEFRHMKHLTILNVSHNKFLGQHFFHVICQLKSLRILWANGNGISEIPPEIQELQKLRTLGLRRNKIRALPRELFLLEELRWLTLNSNRIQEIPYEIGNLKKLVHLNLQRNQIMRLPTAMIAMEKLQYLFLQNNFLVVDHDVKQLIRNIPKLKTCYLSENLGNRDNRSDTEDVEEVNEIRNDDPTASTNATPWGVSRSTSPMGLLDLNEEEEEIFMIGILNEMDEDRLRDHNNNHADQVTGDGQEAETDRDDLFTVYRKSPESHDAASVAPVPLSSDDGGSQSVSVTNPQPQTSPQNNIEAGPSEAGQEVLQIQSSITDSSSRMRRTEEWIMHHHPDEEEVSENRTSEHVDLPLQESEGRMNLRSNDAITSSNHAVFVMPQGREPEPIRIPSIQANLICRRSVSNLPELMSTDPPLSPVSGSRPEVLEPMRLSILASGEEQEVTTVFDGTIPAANTAASLWVQPQAITTPNNGTANETVISTTIPVRMAPSSRLQIQFEPNYDYDPSDWENSTPSSAIDDQDILTRISDFHLHQEEAEEEQQESESYPPMNEKDWLTLLPMFFIQ